MRTFFRRTVTTVAYFAAMCPRSVILCTLHSGFDNAKQMKFQIGHTNITTTKKKHQLRAIQLHSPHDLHGEASHQKSAIQSKNEKMEPSSSQIGNRRSKVTCSKACASSLRQLLLHIMLPLFTAACEADSKAAHALALRVGSSSQKASPQPNFFGE